MSSAPLTTRERILTESARLFHEQGFAATSMREIAQAVGIEASSLYNHITGKEQLLEEICFSVSRSFQENLLKMEVERNLPLDKIKFLFRYHVEKAMTDFTAVTAFNDEWRHLPSEARIRFSEERRSYENFIQSLVTSGQRLGEFNSELDPAWVTKTLLSSTRWMYFSNLKRSGRTVDEIFTQWCQLILNGLVN